LLCLALLLCGCRTRTHGGGQSGGFFSGTGAQTDETQQGENVSADSARMMPGENENAPEEIGEPANQTKENPEASRKEYNENAPAEIAAGTARFLHEPGEGDGASAAEEDAETRADRVNEQAEETAVQTVAAETAEQMGVSDDADAADSALTYFTVLLQDRMGSLFECQRLNVYWETVQDHVTIHRTSLEHTLILNAGCYDVSARLLPENLLVDDGWVARKNPGVIVKIVDSGVLGSVQAPKAMVSSLRNRAGWASIDAVQNRRILLLSEDLLQAPYLQTAAMVMIAGTANPDLFAGVDPDQMLQMLMEEATGTVPAKVYYYKED
jgi:hypothetical protein